MSVLHTKQLLSGDFNMQQQELCDRHFALEESISGQNAILAAINTQLININNTLERIENKTIVEFKKEMDTRMTEFKTEMGVLKTSHQLLTDKMNRYFWMITGGVLVLELIIKFWPLLKKIG